MATRAEASHDVTEEQYEPGLDEVLQPADHQIVSWLTGFQLSLTYGLGARFGVDVALPVRITVIDAEFHDRGGDRIGDFTSIHHRDDTIAGIGDLRLGLRYGLVRPTDVTRLSVDLKLGVSFPTGHVEDDPYALGAEGKSHTHTFFGQGAYLPQLGLELIYSLPAGQFVVSADGQISTGPREKGYEAPTFGSFGVGFSSGYGLESVRFLIRQELYAESESYWNGVPAENSGRTDLNAVVGVTGLLPEDVTLGVVFKIPYFTATNGGQYSSPLFMALSLGWGVDTL